MFSFEKLEVWQEAIIFTDEIYRLTGSFPSEERFGLVSQMRRAAVSISSNIAEGSSRSSRKDYSRYVELAYGSLMEVASQLHVAHRQNMISDSQLQQAKNFAEKISRMLSGLKSSLEKT